MAPLHRGHLYTGVAAFLWGTSFVAIELGSVDYGASPYTAVVLRFAIAALAILPLAWWMGKLRPSLFLQPSLWGLAGLNGLAFTLQYLGQSGAETTASKASLLVDINVVFVALIAYLALRERLASRAWVGVACGAFGLVILVTGLDLSILWEGRLASDLTTFASGIVWAFYIVYVRRQLLRGAEPLELGVALVLGTLVLLSPLWFFQPPETLDLGAGLWIVIAYTGVVNTTIPLLLWVKGLQTISATASATVMLLEVVVALALAPLLLENELLADFRAAGVALILAAIFLVGSAEPQPVPEPSAAVAPVPSALPVADEEE